MADRVRISLSECEASVAKLRNKMNELRDYINNDVNSTVETMSNWWIGDAYNAFKSDFGETKTILDRQVIQEIEDYISRLDKAVRAQSQQDTENAGNIGIN